MTAVHTNHQDIKGQLADLMAHKESAAQRYYKLQEKQQSRIKAASHLPAIMRAANKASKEVTSITNVNEENPISTKGTKEGQTKWNKQEIEAIREHFHEEINKKSVTMAVVREKLKGHPTLSNEDAKKVCDSVRSEWRGIHSESRLESAGAAELPTEQDTLLDKMGRFLSSSSEFEPPSNSSYLSRNIFSREEKESLYWLFGATIRSGIISKPAVRHSQKRQGWQGILREIYDRTDHKPFKVREMVEQKAIGWEH